MSRDDDRDDDLAREIRAHLELEAEERVAEGAGSAEARDAARRAFGNVTRIREEARAVWRRPWLEQTDQDVRYAARMFARTPGFTVIAVLTMALGIGATTAIFSVVHAVLLRPLPFPHSDRVVDILEMAPPEAGANGVPGRIGPLRPSELAALRSRTTTLSHVGVYLPTIRTMTAPDGPVRLIGVRLSPDLLAMADTPPLIGRLFAPHEDAVGAEPVVILSYRAWQRYFAGDRDLAGRSVALDGRPHTVVGVMGPDFSFPSPQEEFWMPFPTAGPMAAQRFPITARLKDGVTLAAAQAEITAVVPAVSEPRPGPAPDGARRFELTPLLDLAVAPVKPALLVLSAAVGFVLLIACANVANLLLARAAARQREHAVRLALGAGRGRLVRQALAESILLALAGGAAAIALAYGGVRLLRTLGASLPRRDLGPALSIPRLPEVGIDGTVLIFTLAIATLAGIGFGLIAAVRHSGPQPMDLLRQGAASPISGFDIFRRHRRQGLLVIAQIAMAMMLLVGGGLMIRSFWKLVSVDPGYDARNLLTFQVALPGPDEQLRRLADDLVERLRTLPGVRAAGYAESLPMTQVSARPTPIGMTSDAARPRLPMSEIFTADMPDARLVSPDFMTTMGIPMVAGRGFREDDRPGQPRVMLVNRTLASSGFLGESVLGKRVYAMGTDAWEIVGIVEDVRQTSLSENASPQIFMNFRQVADSEPLAGVGLYFAVRTDGEAAPIASALRRLVPQLDPQLMLENVATMDALVSNSVARPRLYAVLLGIFSAVAVVLAAIGIYGVMAYAVTQRTREIGVRLALGASGSQMMRLVLGQSLVLTMAGVLVGLAGAVAVTRYLDQLLFGLTALDAGTYVAVSALFGLVATVAAFVPARRAMRVDPLQALRFE